MEVQPIKVTTQFNITVLWSDKKGNILHEFNSLRIYVKDANGEGTCNDHGAKHDNSFCVTNENTAGQKIWSVIEKKMMPKTPFVTLELKMFKESGKDYNYNTGRIYNSHNLKQGFESNGFRVAISVAVAQQLFSLCPCQK